MPVLKTIRKYLEILNLQCQDTMSYMGISHSIDRNPQLGSTLDTSITHEMVQEFSRERLLMYHTLYNLTTPFIPLGVTVVPKPSNTYTTRELTL